MRFKNSYFYNINELVLDEDNYRFGFAKSQKECIELIYKDSPESFENLFKDLMTNNIGDYPLVYLDKSGSKIVFDGNRRISILKIINDPDLAPNEKIKNIAKNLNKNDLPFDLNRIGCFVSKNKDEILKTVYERHAAGQGISRINWSAFATAKFRLDRNIKDSDWRATAILIYLISIDSVSEKITRDPGFSFEVFKRLIRHAYLNGYLHFDIFNNEKNVLHTESPFFDLGLDLTKQLLINIENREVSLSRGGNYASEPFISDFFAHHYSKITSEKPPKNKKPLKNLEKNNNSEIAELSESTTLNNKESVKDGDLEEPFSLVSTDTNSNSKQKTFNKLNKPSYAKKIEKNKDLVDAINKLDIAKYNALYQSLLDIDVQIHPLLTVVGIWSLLDSLAHHLNPKLTSDFVSYFNGKLDIEHLGREEKKVIKAIFEWFLIEGNFNKHSGNYATINGLEICQKFNQIQTYIAHVVNKEKTVAKL
ncbi:hypothetical protein [Acinetobacter variabilis]|uniref:hypothetical protein n=1 Tax=Acinetobacter variabilis TaxID=70346 RepID=UPI00133103F6|nr:hypothetical protein [Acinetobacter variabilis]